MVIDPGSHMWIGCILHADKVIKDLVGVTWGGGGVVWGWGGACTEAWRQGRRSESRVKSG